MTLSPDLSAIVDLRVHDSDPQTLALEAVAAIRDRLDEPTWNPHPGDPEAVLIEAVSVEQWPFLLAANRAPWASILGFLALLGVPWNQGQKATATLGLKGTPSAVIPAGLQVVTDVEGMSQQVVFTTTTSCALNGSGVGTVTGQAQFVGVWPHVFKAGSAVRFVSPIIQLESATLNTRPTGGLDAEPIDAYYVRIASRLRRLSDTLTNADSFTAYTLEQPYVQRCRTLDRWNGTGTPRTSDLGHITVVACRPGGDPLTDGEASALIGTLRYRGTHDLQIHLLAPTVVPIDITATVERLPGYTNEAIIDNIEAALARYITPDSWGWDVAVEPSILVEVISGAEGVYSVRLPTFRPLTTVDMDKLSLPTVGALTITVVDP